MEGADSALTLDQGEDRPLAGRAGPAALGVGATLALRRGPRIDLLAEVGFVGLDHLAHPAKGFKHAFAHRLPDAVRHEPGGFQGDAQGAVKLVRADALLARPDQVDGLQPMPHLDVAALKDGSDLHGEGLAALVALVEADPGALAAHLADALHPAAVRADGAVRPDPRLDPLVSGLFVVKARIAEDGSHGLSP